METRANYVLIGVFTLAIVVGVFGFIFWLHRAAGTGDLVSYRVIFDGAVSGLRTGGPVLFNGIRVGVVRDMQTNPQDPSQVVAMISVNKTTPVRQDTRVTLDFQGLTGIASVSLKGGTASTPALEGVDGEPPTLVADRSSGQDMGQAARDVLTRIDGLVAANEAALHDAITNLGAFSATLARNSDRIDHIMAGLDNLAGGPDGKGDIPEAVRSFKQLADNLDKRTAEITVGINRLTATGTKQIELLVTDGRRTLSSIDQAVTDLAHNPQRIIFGGGGSSAPAPATPAPVPSRR
jgi:phospholipid/cholesterol/gamma-HCH transport system substrate-binding protein